MPLASRTQLRRCLYAASISLAAAVNVGRAAGVWTAFARLPSAASSPATTRAARAYIQALRTMLLDAAPEGNQTPVPITSLDQWLRALPDKPGAFLTVLTCNRLRDELIALAGQL